MYRSSRHISSVHSICDLFVTLGFGVFSLVRDCFSMSSTQKSSNVVAFGVDGTYGVTKQAGWELSDVLGRGGTDDAINERVIFAFRTIIIAKQYFLLFRRRKRGRMQWPAHHPTVVTSSSWYPLTGNRRLG